MNFSSVIIAILVIFLNFLKSNGIDRSYKKCSAPAPPCGKLHNIGYPFWGNDWRPKDCGHPEFELQCRPEDIDDYPILHINQSYDQAHPYEVLGIDCVAKTVQLREFHCRGDPGHCLMSFSDIAALGTNPFEYSTRVDNITLFYDCSWGKKGAPPGVKNVPCSDHEGHPGSACYWESCERKDELNYPCHQQIQVPVLRKDDHEQGQITLESVFEWAFEVNYSMMYLRNCSTCETYGGSCGWSSNSPFVCYYKGSESEKWKLIVAIALPAALIFLTALIAGFFWCKKREFQPQILLSRTMSYEHMRSDLEIGNSFYGIPVFSYTELQEATNNFDPNWILGDGGFGIVYHGKLRDGREVAVKRLYERNYKKVEQFMTEVEILTTLKHPNLVTLYGCTSRHSRELLLVFEYIPNGTVADHLYGDRAESTPLTWAIRMKIAIETASALSYLHASDVIHRDVKTNNILLDDNFSVKVADFGLSRFFPVDVTHVSTAPQGTPGYLDPEYHKCYQVTNKSDVYSLGVVLVELISSMPAVDIDRNEDEINLSTYAMNKIRQGALDELVDQKLGFESDFKVKRTVTLVAELAFNCLQQEKDIRPSMDKVLEALKRIESLDFEALEAEEVNRGSERLKPASGAAESEVEQPLRNPENPNSSPKSVIEGWATRSSVSNASG